MSSINLLPENIRLKEDEDKEKKIVFVFSVFLLLMASGFCVGAYASKAVVKNKLDVLSLEIEKNSQNMEKEIDRNALFLAKNEVSDITKLLNDHRYFSQAFRVVQDIVADDVYLQESNLRFNKEGKAVMEISGIANNHQAAVNQTAVFKNSYWIDQVVIDSIVLEQEGKVVFSGILEFKENIVLFQSDYWKYGLSLLSPETNRYLKVNEYSAILKESNQDGKDILKVDFSGIAYDEKKLILLESNLKQIDVAQNISIVYNLNKQNNNGIIDFRGSVEFEMP